MVAVVLTPIVAQVGRKVDARLLATIAFLSFAVSYYMRSRLTVDASFADFVLPLLVQGVAMSTFFVAMLNILLDGIPPERVPSATGISNFLRITSGSFAASITTTMWDRRETLHQSRLVEAANAASPAYRGAVERLNALGLSDLQAAGVAIRQIGGQAYLIASTDLFRLSAWLCFALAATVWLARRPEPHEGPIAAD